MERNIMLNNEKYKLIGTKKRVGDVAENFKVVDINMEYIDFYDLPSGVKIVSSCSSINTPMCSKQSKRLNAEVYISTRNIEALIISADLPFALKRFSFEEDIEHARLLSDHQNLDFGYKYGVVIDKLRILSRALFIIDKNHIIKYVEYITDNEKQFNYIKAISVAKSLQKE